MQMMWVTERPSCSFFRHCCFLRRFAGNLLETSRIMLGVRSVSMGSFYFFCTRKGVRAISTKCLFAYRPHYKAQNRRLWCAAAGSMAFVRADLLTRVFGASCLATAERGSMCAGGGFWSDRVWSDRVWLRCAERIGATGFDLPHFLYFIRTFVRVGASLLQNSCLN